MVNLGQPRPLRHWDSPRSSRIYIYIYICFGRLFFILRGRQHKSGPKAYIYIYIYALGPRARRAHSFFDAPGAGTVSPIKNLEMAEKTRRIIQSDLTRSTARRGRRILGEGPTS